MPKTNLCKPRVDPRIAEVQAIIAAGMKRKGIHNNADLAKKTGMAQSTLNLRLREPSQMRLGELWNILDVLQAEEEDKRKIV